MEHILSHRNGLASFLDGSQERIRISSTLHYHFLLCNVDLNISHPFRDIRSVFSDIV